jgi:hypothetical protein
MVNRFYGAERTRINHNRLSPLAASPKNREPKPMTQAPLISMLVIGFGLAFLFGTLANRLKLSPIAGYLMAGVRWGRSRPASSAIPAWRCNWPMSALFC